MRERWRGLQSLTMRQGMPQLARQTALLFIIDTLTNAVDYAYHIFLGRNMLPGDFAAVQTVNSTLLIMITVFGVLQPVVARFVVESKATASPDDPQAGSRSIFRAFLGHSAWVGLALTGLVIVGRNQLARWLNVPPLAVTLSSSMMLFSLMRPVVGGVLQGRERFLAFGLTRSAYALARFAVGVALVAMGMGITGALAAMPIGSALAWLCGLAFLGASIWKPAPKLGSQRLSEGLRLSLAAFVAFGAYMALLNNDLLWINRSLDANVAGSYATAVLLRRVVTLLPNAAVVIMYPRVVARVAAGRLPDRLLGFTAGIVAVSGGVLAALYFALGSTIIRVAFGASYVAAGPWLGWIAVGTVGYALAAIWTNLYLAVKPWPYTLFLAAMGILQYALLAAFHDSVGQVMAIFAACGWALVAGGGVLYLAWLRPAIRSGKFGSITPPGAADGRD